MKKEMITYNMKTFGNVAIGIHGKELPKFADRPESRQYWKRDNSYVEEPKIQSWLKLRQSQKYWAKPDLMLLNKTSDEPGPADPFKTVYVPKPKKVEICQKVNELNLFENQPTGDAAAKRPARWTATVQKFMKQDKGAYEEDPGNRSSLVKQEMEPLYSSFSPDKVFADPLTKSRTKPSYSDF